MLIDFLKKPDINSTLFIPIIIFLIETACFNIYSQKERIQVDPWHAYEECTAVAKR